MINKFNTFHFVTGSPWPTLASIQISSTIVSSILILCNNASNISATFNIIILSIISSVWWINTSTEANNEGLHLNNTTNGINISILLFISSEILFFTSFFWAYFHSSTSPNIEIGQNWPPNQIETFNPNNVPLLNTIILISSGFSITWSHHLLIENNTNNSQTLLILTCLLGVYFSILQNIEYEQAQFSITDSTYGNIFFIATGFHGVHVLIGSCFLIVNVLFMNKMLINNNHHVGFEIAAWYWHFVDVVWLILYLSIYWWGN